MNRRIRLRDGYREVVETFGDSRIDFEAETTVEIRDKVR